MSHCPARKKFPHPILMKHISMLIPVKPFEIKLSFSQVSPPNEKISYRVGASHQATGFSLHPDSQSRSLHLSSFSVPSTSRFPSTVLGFQRNSVTGPSRHTCATLMKWEMTAALWEAVGLLSTMSWIHWETLLKRVMKRSRMGLSTVQPCITKLW